MDSQENVLNNEAQLEETNSQPVAEEEVKVEETVVKEETEETPAAEETVAKEEAPAEVAEEPVAEESADAEPAKKVFATKQEVIERLKELAHGDESPTKEEVDLLKTTFYKLHFAQREAEMKAYLEGGGDPEKYSVLPDEDICRTWFSIFLCEKWSVVRHEIIKRVDRDKVTVSERNVRVDYSYLYPGCLNCGRGTIHRGAEGHHAVLVRKGNLYHSRSQLDRAVTVKPLGVKQVDWQVISVSGVDIGPHVGAYEETLLEEYSGVFRVGIRSRPFGVEMVEMEVFHLSGVCSPDQSVNQDVRHTGHTPEMNMVSRPDGRHGLIGSYIMDFFHVGPFIPAKIMK